ncbi:MAG: hypothetical protein ACE5K2_04945 [Candidatus Zixiibacteriota bacterium]
MPSKIFGSFAREPYVGVELVSTRTHSGGVNSALLSYLQKLKDTVKLFYSQS